MRNTTNSSCFLIAFPDIAMTDRRSPRISSRKQPKQARSTELVAAILEAAVQVLAKEGAPRFTTARVAEKAGVSIGSVYQYFPNKAAILFRLQSDEWRQTSELLRGILEDVRKPRCSELHTGSVPRGLRSDSSIGRRLDRNDAQPGGEAFFEESSNRRRD
jgi:AcrR family transcriptional regulator